MTSGKKLSAALDLAVSFFALVLGLVIVFPVIYTVFVAFMTRRELSIYPPGLLPESFLNTRNFETLFEMVPLLRFMVNSVIVSALGSSLRITIAVLAAYALAYFEFPLRRFLFMAVLGTMMLPADTLIVTNYLTVTRINLLDNYLGMCITSLVGASQMFMLRQNFKTIPRSFRDAAFIDGCGDIRYLYRIAAPLSSPVILTLLVQSFISFWNAYLWPLLVTNSVEMRTVQIGISMLTNPMDTNYTIVLAAVAVLLIPSLFLFSLLRLAMVKGIAAGALVI
ncbi:MAG: carbohydrate ABC transporter permease [Treponema sp.]|jgi:sn-glycerol 3-phosphate transport system permease protein|nr:carbohydrate ABC transporter permease [Treponema sp.]